MRWGVEVWDRFDDVSSYVHRGIDFCDKYEEFLKKRCTIENTYAKSLRKLIEAYEPKKKETTDDAESTLVRCFVRMLDELRDVAGQHELVAENMQEKVLGRLGQVVRSLKDERRKCMEDKERYMSEHVSAEELLDKCKQKYEKAYREVEKAEEQLNRVENDDSASKNDIKKQKAVCDQKKRQYDGLEAEYAKQLCEANRVKNAYYFQHLPAIFDDLQTIEKKRIESFKDFVIDCVKIEVEVLPRIKQCYNEVESSARSIDAEQDTDVAVRLYKTGYTVPGDHVFEDLKQQSTNSQNGSGSGSVNGLSGGVLSGTSATLSVNSMGSASNASSGGGSSSRAKKYRTLNRIKGLLSLTGGAKSEQESLYDLPPQQLKNELLKKINFCQYEIEKYQKEREGLNKLKDIYSKNQKFGDSGSADAALRLNDEKTVKAMSDLKRYQDLYNQVEQQYSYGSNHSEYSSSASSSGSSGGGGGGAVPRANGTAQYQSPAVASAATGGFPSTPLSAAAAHQRRINGGLDSNAVAYAVSPVSQLSNTAAVSTAAANGNGSSNGANGANPKMAPLVNSNESFDEDEEGEEDDEDEDEEEDYEEGGGYESPANALRSLPAKLDVSSSNGNRIKEPSQQIGFVYQSTTTTTTTSTNGNGNGTTTKTNEAQYDQVDACLYDQPGAGGTATEPGAEIETQIGTALVMYSFDGNVQNSIAILENESLSVLEKDSGDGWTLVKRLNGEKGYVPTDYIQIVYY